MSCGSPRLVPGTDDATWFVERGYVVMHRLDGRAIAVPLQQGAARLVSRSFYFCNPLK
jgi:hypothetical protein